MKSKKTKTKGSGRGKLLVLSLLTLAVMGTSVALSYPKWHQADLGERIDVRDDEEKDEGGTEVSKIQARGLVFGQLRANATDRTSTVNYTIDPPRLSDLDFDCSLSWAEEYDEGFESETWKEGKDVNDYMGFTLDKNKQEITFHCLDNFGWRINFHMACQQNKNVYANLSLECRRVYTSEPTFEFENDGKLEEGKGFHVIYTPATTTVGTIAIKKEEHTNMLKFTGSYTNDDGETEWCYSEELYTFKADMDGYDELIEIDGILTRRDEAAKKIQTKVENYLESILNQGVLFHKADFEALFKYSYVSGRENGADVYTESKDALKNFYLVYDDMLKKGVSYEAWVITKENKATVASHMLYIPYDLTEFMTVKTLIGEVIFG